MDEDNDIHSLVVFKKEERFKALLATLLKEDERVSPRLAKAMVEKDITDPEQFLDDTIHKLAARSDIRSDITAWRLVTYVERTIQGKTIHNISM